MAFEIKDEAPVEQSDRVLITGIANLSIAALNPTKAEQEAMGRKPKEEPVYFQMNKAGTAEQIQLDIYLAGAVTPDGENAPVDVMVKHTIWIENSTSRGVYIDKFGKFGKDAGKLDASARLSYNGEVDLVQFLKCLCNLGQKDTAGLDNAKALVSKGDLSEIKGIFNQAHNHARKDGGKGRKVRVLLGIKDQKYQDVFAKQFEYEGEGGTAYLHKQVVKQAQYDRDNGRNAPYLGPINTLSDAYSPSAYVARRYDPTLQEQFEASLPKGSFGGGPGTGAFSGGGPAAQSFNGGGPGLPQQSFAQSQPRMQPQFAAAIGGEDDDLPF